MSDTTEVEHSSFGHESFGLFYIYDDKRDGEECVCIFVRKGKAVEGDERSASLISKKSEKLKKSTFVARDMNLETRLQVITLITYY